MTSSAVAATKTPEALRGEFVSTLLRTPEPVRLLIEMRATSTNLDLLVTNLQLTQAKASHLLGHDHPSLATIGQARRHVFNAVNSMNDVIRYYQMALQEASQCALAEYALSTESFDPASWSIRQTRTNVNLAQSIANLLNGTPIIHLTNEGAASGDTTGGDVTPHQ